MNFATEKKEKIIEALKEYKKGTPTSEIYEKFKISGLALNSWRRKAGVPDRQHLRQYVNWEEIIEAVGGGIKNWLKSMKKR